MKGIKAFVQTWNENKKHSHESFAGQMKVLASCFVPVFIMLMLAARAHAAGPQSSADYHFSVESLDGGGLRTASADYAADGSFDTGNFITSADYAQRGGYIGQLPNAPVATNYTFTVVSNNTIEIPLNSLLSSANDPDGDSISFVSIANTSAQNGIAEQVGNWVSYKPPAGFTGTDSIIWVMKDSEGDQNTGTILTLVVASPPLSNLPTLNQTSITFDTATNTTDATLRFVGLPQATYLVQYTGSLIPPITWTNLGSATVTNGVFTIVDPTARSANQRYYRTVFQSQ